MAYTLSCTFNALLTELEVAEIKRCVQRAIRDEKG